MELTSPSFNRYSTLHNRRTSYISTRPAKRARNTCHKLTKAAPGERTLSRQSYDQQEYRCESRELNAGPHRLFTGVMAKKEFDSRPLASQVILSRSVRLLVRGGYRTAQKLSDDSSLAGLSDELPYLPRPEVRNSHTWLFSNGKLNTGSSEIRRRNTYCSPQPDK